MSHFKIDIFHLGREDESDCSSVNAYSSSEDVVESEDENRWEPQSNTNFSGLQQTNFSVEPSFETPQFQQGPQFSFDFQNRMNEFRLQMSNFETTANNQNTPPESSFNDTSIAQLLRLYFDMSRMSVAPAEPENPPADSSLFRTTGDVRHIDILAENRRARELFWNQR